MDEPTNHLDIDSIHSLSIALNSFQGGIVVVSHDQYFVSSICSKIMVVRNQKLKEFHGDFKAYKSSQKKRRVTEEKKLYTPNLQ
jgi:ATPase subunit of ABC transporter with duplicated ATPase domains